MNRRDFLCAAGASVAFPFVASAQGSPARSGRLTSLYVDALGGLTGFDETPDGRHRVGPGLAQAIRERRLDVISQTVEPVGNGPDRFRDAVQRLAMFRQLIRDNSELLAAVESVADIRAARAAGKLAVIFNFQDTTPLEGDAGRVETFAELGIKIMQLTYNMRNLAGDGCLERSNAGLSVFGREVIARINGARLLLDLSHAGQRTQAEGIAASTRPPAITHSGCRALADLPRNTHDTEMRALAEKGGVFGVYMMPFLRTQGGQATQEDMLRHLDHAVNVCGEDHVGIGTDNPLMGFTINDEMRERQRRFFEDRQRRGIAAPGEAADVFNLVEGYNNVDRFDRMASDLRRRGWSAARIDKVLGNNFVRLFGEVWGG